VVGLKAFVAQKLKLLIIEDLSISCVGIGYSTLLMPLGIQHFIDARLQYDGAAHIDKKA